MCKTESIRGLYVKDYRDLDVQALEEIICLNEQLKTNLKQIRLAVNDGVNQQALWLLDILLEDNDTHTDYCKQCQEEILADMECTDASTHFEDYTDEILEEMECHEASTHFEDYMNEPIESQTSDNDVQYENCMNMHNEATSSIECLECNKSDCPYSRG